MRVRAWIVPLKDAQNPLIFLASPPRAPLLLEKARDLSATEIVFWVLHGDGSRGAPLGAPVSTGLYMENSLEQDPDGHRVVLEGSASIWRRVRSMWDAGSSRMELVLAIDG